MTHRAFDLNQEKDIAARYEAGESTLQLAAAYGVNPKTVRTTLLRHGTTMRRVGTRGISYDQETRERIQALYDEGLSQQQIGNQIGCSQVIVSRTLQEMGVKTRLNRRKGAASNFWKGGRALAAGGYQYVRSDEFPEMQTRTGYVLEHRLVMARHLGRPLKKHEQVHHKDADRRNNVIENLELMIGPHGSGATEAHCPTCTCFAETD